MGIMQLWGGHGTDEDMARAKRRTLDEGGIDTWVRRLRLALKDVAAFKDALKTLTTDRAMTAADLIEIAYRFTGSKVKTKKAAVAAIGQERLRIAHARAKGESASKTRTW